MREIILGTAGHVDHGKTSLIRALTGIETDRLKEEKARGITIELGFAHLDLPCGHRLGIVDVPGHEKFVRNMVAGVAGMDMVAFIIAADEGIMPQTIEHFNICKLIGVKEGLIILSKKDMVDEDWLEMVEEEVEEFFQDSFLEKAPILKVSSTTGEGIEEIKQVLDQKVRAINFQEEFGPFRLAVDRVFSMKGFGTVITGTSLSGRISIGDELTFYPGELTAKIRTIQVHGKGVDMVEAGHRTAINLQGIEKDEINRGDMAATPDSMSPANRVDGELHYLADDSKGDSKPLKNRTAVRVHVGTREILGRVILMEKDKIEPGEDAYIQLILQHPVAVWPGDKFVIRSYSPVTTIGGGTIINNAPPKRKRTLAKDKEQNLKIFKIYGEGTEEEKLLLFLEESGTTGITADQLASRLGIFGKKLKKFLQQPVSTGKIVVVESERQRFVAAVVLEKLNSDILNKLTIYHRQNPLKNGLIREELRSLLTTKVDLRLLNFSINLLLKKRELIQEDAEIKLTGHSVTLQIDEEDMQEKIAELYLKAGLKPANLKDIILKFKEFPEERIRQIIELLIQQEQLIKVNESLCFHKAAIESIEISLIDFIKREGEIDAPGFKNMTGLSRKFSIPLLEYFDKIKLTIRIDDKRVLRK
jgi:selenocysteine-specific elongation factor